jgi:hypothetical protein
MCDKVMEVVCEMTNSITCSMSSRLGTLGVSFGV